MIAVDLANGRIRIPALSRSGAKAVLPDRRTEVAITLRGQGMESRYDPRMGPDRERSGVLHVGRDVLRALVEEGEILMVQAEDAGEVTLE